LPVGLVGIDRAAGEVPVSRAGFDHPGFRALVDKSAVIHYCSHLSLQGEVLTERMRTYVPEGREAESLSQGPKWVVVDAAGQVLGRVATRVARVLIGKDKPNFTPYLDCGDHVVVINAQKIRLTGNKLEQKIYRTHSGYPGGLKEVPAKRIRGERADWMIREAVLGMLPKNRLRASRARKLRVYLDDKGLARHAGQKPQPLAL
jgi:large subunit ribosomal protein L13